MNGIVINGSAVGGAIAARFLSERPRPARLRAWRHAWWLAVATVCVGAFMGQLDASVVTLTYGALQDQFHASPAAVEWVSLAYLLTLVALLVPVGRLADAWGRKLVYIDGFIVFAGASAACGLAPSLPALIGLRVLQAVGAAMLQANSVALVTTSAPRRRMRAALGVQAAAQALGLALGPTIGGLMVATIGWRWVFGINVPIGLAAVVASRYLLPRTRERTDASGFDWLGLGLLATATTTLLLAISTASGLRLPGWSTVLLALAAVASGRAFLVRQRRAATPLVDVALLGRRAVRWGLVGALCGYLVLFGPLVLVPRALGATGVSGIHTGLVLTALPAGFAAAALRGDVLLPRGWTNRRRCLTGATIATAALLTLVWAPMTPTALVPLLAVLGVGLGLFIPANNAMVMGAIPARASGTGGGLVNMTRGLGTALGIALVTLVLQLPGLGHADASVGAPRLAFLALTAAGALAILTIPDDERGRAPRR